MGLFILVWFTITLFLSYEYFVLNFIPHLSLFLQLQKWGLISADLKINTIPGHPLSYWLGWIGFSLMVIMNVYSMRTRFSSMRNWGKLSHWLNFHIFCGLLGPTLIIFHSGLKVRGLVGISFWSMVISLLSGIVGRYFFTQLSSKKEDLQKQSKNALALFDRSLEKYKIKIPEPNRLRMLQVNMAHFGGVPQHETLTVISALLNAIRGDWNRIFSGPLVPDNWPPSAKYMLTHHSIFERRIQSLSSFETAMGYWHLFHFPFAIFMYIAAVIHIISSLIFVTNG